MKTETTTEKCLTKGDFENRFIEDLGDCVMKKAVLKKTVMTLTYPDMPDSVFHDYTVVIEVTLTADIFRNKAMLNIDCIDFENRCLSGHVKEDHIANVLLEKNFQALIKDV
ncbi:MAG: hypothetical protein LBK58_10265 [Prevotellaceae bacterium]|jgi:hypothetical protein|nr:hypothetical protein [Prevotellaceae bacterium]